MRKKAGSKGIPLLALLAVLSAGDLVFASGSYTGRPPRQPASLDRGMYELGKKVFAGEFAKSSAPTNAAAQGGLLNDLHESLPRKARAKSQLASFAGQLSDGQVEALQYFLQKRYKIK